MLNQTQTQTDVMDIDRARALQATLGAEPSIASGDALPPFYHQIYFWDPQPDSRLGDDGLALGGDLMPDLGLPRRMWAAGRLIFHAPLRAGSKAERSSRVEAVTRKTGRSGPLAFLQIRHDIRQRGGLVLTEWQDIVYRPDAPLPAPDPTPARTDEKARHQVTFAITQLFRYSALTLNAHRIHYDDAYARDTEGYDGLVVQGPLHAQMLMTLAAAQLGTLTEFSYRAIAPAFAGETLDYCWNDGAVWVRGADGRTCMTGTAR